MSFSLVLESGESLHVHDMSLVNSVGKFTCQPGKLYKDAMPKGIGKSSRIFNLPTLSAHVNLCMCVCIMLNNSRFKFDEVWWSNKNIANYHTV